MNKFCSIFGIIVLGIFNIYSGSCCGKSKEGDKSKKSGSNGCCCCKGKENRSSGTEKPVVQLTISKNKIVLGGKDYLAVSEENNPRLTRRAFECIYYAIDKYSFDNIKNIKLSINSSEEINMSKEIPYLIVAVMSTAGEYYIIYCKDANAKSCTINNDGEVDFGLFGGVEELKKIKILCNGRITDYRFMFSTCKELESADLSKLNTCEATSMYGMFLGCIKLKVLDVSSFNTTDCVNNSCSLMLFGVLQESNVLEKIILGDNFSIKSTYQTASPHLGGFFGVFKNLNCVEFKSKINNILKDNLIELGFALKGNKYVKLKE